MLPTEYQPDIPPFEHQRLALEAGWNRKGFAYFLEMGLGKSRVTIDNFCLLLAKGMCDGLLVIAPKSVYTNWSRWDDHNPGEIQKWLWKDVSLGLKMHTYRSGAGARDKRERTDVMDHQSFGPRVLVVNAEALAATKDCEELCRQFMRAHRTMIVIDESTLIKNPSSLRTKSCLKLATLAEYRRILTGSPSTGSQADLWAQFEFLGPGEQLLGQRLYTLFRARYCNMQELVVAGRTIKVERGPQRTDELAGIVAKHSFRRKKADCLDLPEKVYQRREVPLTSEQELAYKELKRSAMTEIQGSEVTTQLVITQLMRMHQVVCGHVKADDGRILELKTNRVDALLEVVGETDEQTIIWCMYRPDAERVVSVLRKEYGPECVAEWHGGRSQAEREEGENDFQAGRKRFMVSTQAGARGRTWTAATLVVYYANSHDLEVRQQSEDRCHRIGTVGTVTYVDLVCPGTVDEKIIDALRAKRNIAAAVLREGLTAWI